MEETKFLFAAAAARAAAAMAASNAAAAAAAKDAGRVGSEDLGKDLAESTGRSTPPLGLQYHLSAFSDFRQLKKDGLAPGGALSTTDGAGGLPPQSDGNALKKHQHAQQKAVKARLGTGKVLVRSSGKD